MSGVSRVRPESLVIVFALVLLAIGLYTGLFGAPILFVSRPLFVLLVVWCGVVLLPSGIFPRNSAAETAFNVLLLAAVTVSTLYFMVNWADLVWESYLYPFERVLAVLLILGVVEITRRTRAKPLIGIMIAFMLYARYGAYFPGILSHPGVTWENILRITVLGSDGMFGTPIGFAASFVATFVFLVAFINASGAANYLLDLAFRLAGTWTGGPGKVAVLGSAFMGMASGSGVTNVLTTGTITIPMMKRMGYPGEFAAGVEAVASQGSQFVPPIMGAAVYLMAEYTGVPFLKLAGMALIPAFLYYLAVFMQVHFRSMKLNLKGVPRDELPALGPALRGSLVIILPLALLMVLLFQRLSTQYAVSVTFLAFLVVATIYRDTRILTRPEKMKEGLLEGAKSLVSMTGALALAGIIVGMVLLTGLGARLTYLIQTYASGSLVVGLLLTAGVAILLGLGVVTVGAYVIVASLTAPLLQDLGLPLVIAHLFIFYYATLSGLTPPVAVVVYAASGIADSDPYKTAWTAIKLGFTAWVVPFLFSFAPALIALDGITFELILHLVTASLGVVALSAAFEGVLFSTTTGMERALATLAGIALMVPIGYAAPVGVVALALAARLNYKRTLGFARVPVAS